MKIAVTATDRTLDAQVDGRFGRAACFVVVDPETMAFDIVENDGTAASGAGIGAAKAVIDAGAKAVLTGNCGPNAQRTLAAADIALYTGVVGTVAEAIEQFRTGSLVRATGPNVQPHHGQGA